jgi:hypothetical protein
MPLLAAVVELSHPTALRFETVITARPVQNTSFEPKPGHPEQPHSPWSFGIESSARSLYRTG